METFVEQKTCKHCGKQFGIRARDVEFYDKVSPVINGVKYQVPSPTLCPDCRLQRMLAHRNERKLYKRTCAATQQPIISIYSPDKPYRVYSQKFRWSDARDPFEYGRDFDFSKTFTENFNILFQQVPKLALHGHVSNENSDYVNYFVESKDSYCSYAGGYNEGVLYCTVATRIKYSCDCLSCLDSEYLYNCINCIKSYNLQYCLDMVNCSDCYNCKHCVGCKYCINCDHLENQQYCIFNKQVSKEEFHRFLSESKKNNTFSLSKDTTQVIRNSENCEGSYIYDSKNIYQGFDVFDSSSDCAFVEQVFGYKDSYEVFGAGYGERVYGGLVTTLNIYEAIATSIVRRSQYVYYSQDITGCNHIFGCIGLRNKSYCIFNKQYTKEEYETLVPKIIEHMKQTGEWGEFFDTSLSPFGYNETVANEYYPLSEEEATKKGFKWSHYEAPTPIVDKILEGKDLPNNIQEVEDDILKYAIRCDVTGRIFRIVPQELNFYRKHNIPLPRKHPDQRHLERLQIRR